MHLFRFYQHSFNQLRKTHLDMASLHFQLTAQLAVLFILGLGTLTGWMSWEMQQILVVSHKRTVENAATYIPQAIALYSRTMSTEDSIQMAVADVTAPNLLIWVSRPDGTIAARSPDASPTMAKLMAMAELPPTPEVYQMQEEYLILCGTPLLMNDNPMGKVNLAQDISHDYRQLMQRLMELATVSSVVLALTLVAIARQLRRSLHPLQQISQVARDISMDDLTASNLQLRRPPSEIKGLVDAFNEMLVRLSAVLDQQRQFVSNVSHELRTPLTIVQGYVQSLLRRSTNLSDYQKDVLQTVSGEADRTVRLLQDLLDLARADSGHIHFCLQPIQLNERVREVIEMAQKYSQRQIRFTEVESNVVAIADWDRLKQVLLNLIDNAVKYSDPDQPIDVIVEQTNHKARIQICDRGIGIPLHYQSRIFERFYRVEESRSTEGTGLGLAIVKTLVEGMGGQITVRSKPGEGSIFTIGLPL